MGWILGKSEFVYYFITHILPVLPGKGGLFISKAWRLLFSTNSPYPELSDGVILAWVILYVRTNSRNVLLEVDRCIQVDLCVTVDHLNEGR